MIFLEKNNYIWICQSYDKSTVGPFFPDLEKGTITSSLRSVVQVLMGHFKIFHSHGLSGWFVPKIIKSFLNLSKLRPKYCRSLFWGHGVVFTYHTWWQYSDGDPPNGGVKCRGMQVSWFSIDITLCIANDTTYRSIVTMECQHELVCDQKSNDAVFDDADFKGTAICDVEYLRNDTMWTPGYCKQLIESDMWPIELCHCQWP